jgi:hydroxyacylglutathione hydrolase
MYLPPGLGLINRFASLWSVAYNRKPATARCRLAWATENQLAGEGAMLRYRTIPVTPFQQNCTLIWCDQTHQCVAVDVGGEIDRIDELLEDQRLELTALLQTHGHLDHVAGAGELAKRRGVPLLGPQEEDRFLFEALADQAAMFGFPPVEPFLPERWLKDGEEIQVGEGRLEILHTPGHTPGHVVFFCREGEWAQVGDVLFQGSIGRTDFPRGNHDQLIDSIVNRLLPLGDCVTVIAGHGPKTTIGHERATNPFLAAGRN